MPIQRLNPTIMDPPLSKLYKRYDEITEAHCKYLLNHLYTHNITEWINPITKKEVQRDSYITISFLSKCYWGEWGEKEVTINGISKRYKIHVSYFIDEWYLFDVRFRPSQNLTPVATSPPGAATNKPIINSPRATQGLPNLPVFIPSPTFTGSRPGYVFKKDNQGLGYYLQTVIPVSQQTTQAVLQQKSITPPGSKSPPGAATNKPKSSSSSKSSAKIDYSPTNIKNTIKSMNNSKTSTYILTEEQCKDFIKDIKKKKKGLTANQIKKLQIVNPISKRDIGFKGPIFQSLLYKCYYSFDNDKLKKAIKKVVSDEYLEKLKVQMEQDKIDKKLEKEKEEEAKRLAKEKEDEAKRLAKEKEDEERRNNIPIIDKYIEGLVDEFNKCCDELNNNCENGVLKEYKYISNVINSIIILMYTKYLHLPYYYDELYLNYSSQMYLKIFMYDDTFREYYENKSLVPSDEFKKYFYKDLKKVIYQKNDLTKNVDHNNIILDPKTIENYYLNTLINRQHVFEAFRYDHNNGNNYRDHIIIYNKINTSFYSRLHFNNYKFPNSLKFAKEIIDELNINYNITNGLLPKYIFSRSGDATIGAKKPFSELVDKINDRLGKLPTITGIANEATVHKDKYDKIIKDMRKNSYGDNKTEYGNDDMIRKNLLYSLNAQTPTYIQRNMNQHKQDIYYNYEYTGTYPLFSWIPLNHTNIDSPINQQYCYPMTNKWQPFEIDPDVLKLLELDYKNHGVAPYSTYLNETIYRVITDKYTSVKSLVHANRIQAMTLRIINTIGVYKDKIIKPGYKNNKIYLYHGTKNRLDSIGSKGKKIEILGFLSTSLSIYIASYYSGVDINNVGYIYIIEVDDTYSYINLNDILNQILILPLSRIIIIMEFNIGALHIILCRLFRTPTKEQNKLLYNKLLDIKNDSHDSDDIAGAAGTQRISGGLSTMKHIENKKDLTLKQYTTNIIKPKEDMRKIGDMPEDIRQYYGITLTDKNKNKYIDINNGCYFRLINKKSK